MNTSNNRRIAAAAVMAMLLPATLPAHHSYSMFDLRQAVTIEGTVSKLEWKNPHVFVWIYAKKRGKEPGYESWAFENGPIGLMQRQGWHRNSLTPGEKVIVQYFPLRSGTNGGHFVRLVRADGSELVGDPYAPGIGKELAKGKLGIRPSP